MMYSYRYPPQGRVVGRRGYVQRRAANVAAMTIINTPYTGWACAAALVGVVGVVGGQALPSEWFRAMVLVYMNPAPGATDPPTVTDPQLGAVQVA